MKLEYKKPVTYITEFVGADIVSTSFVIPPITPPQDNEKGLEDDDLYNI